MKTVKINKDKLLKEVQENRLKHINEYNEALMGWREICVKELEKNLNLARSGEKFETVIRAQQPHNYANEYDKVISMLEWTNDVVVELEQHEFDQFVNDNWQWQGGFKALNSTYMSSK